MFSLLKLFILVISLPIYADDINSIDEFAKFVVNGKKEVLLAQVPGSMPGYKIDGTKYGTGGLDLVASSLFQYLSNAKRSVLVVTPKWKNAGIDNKITSDSRYTKLGSFSIKSQIEYYGDIVDVSVEIEVVKFTDRDGPEAINLLVNSPKHNGNEIDIYSGGTSGGKKGSYYTGFNEFDKQKRFAFESKISTAILEEIYTKYPNTRLIFSGHDWTTAYAFPLIDYAIKEARLPHDILTHFVFHNIGYSAGLKKDNIEKLFAVSGYDFYDFVVHAFGGKETINILEFPVLFAKLLTTVSRYHAYEIMNDASFNRTISVEDIRNRAENFRRLYSGYGREFTDIVNTYAPIVGGVFNGLDTKNWSPIKRYDSYENYTGYDNLKKIKTARKNNLKTFQAEVGLEVNDNAVLFTSFARIAHQKNMDNLLKAVSDMLVDPKYKNAQFFICGDGDEGIVNAFKNLQERYPGRLIYSSFSDELQHKAMLAAHFDIAVSNYEPGGLTPAIDFRYGVVPIMTKVGGFVDSMLKAGKDHVVIAEARTSKAILDALTFAYNNEATYKDYIRDLLNLDVSWKPYATQYDDLFQMTTSDYWKTRLDMAYNPDKVFKDFKAVTEARAIPLTNEEKSLFESFYSTLPNKGQSEFYNNIDPSVREHLNVNPPTAVVVKEKVNTDVFIMAPLYIHDDAKEKIGPDARTEEGYVKLLNKIFEMKDVDGVSIDIWMGEGGYSFEQALRYIRHVTARGLKVLPIFSDHRLGGSVNDKKAGKIVPTLYKNNQVEFGQDAFGNVDNSAPSVWGMLQENYQETFESKFNEFIFKLVGDPNINMDLIDGIAIGGATGEIKMPGAQKFREIGNIMAYSPLAVKSFQDYIKKLYSTEGNGKSLVEWLRTRWNNPYLSGINDVKPPQANKKNPYDPNSDLARFWNNKDWQTQYGKDFFDWYNKSLIDAFRLKIKTAIQILDAYGMSDVTITVKVPGLYWKKDHTAELTAGLVTLTKDPTTGKFFVPDNYTRYKNLANMLREFNGRIKVEYTAAELTSNYANKNVGSNDFYSPEKLAKDFLTAMSQAGVKVGLENALPESLYNGDMMAKLQNLAKAFGVESVDILRATELDKVQNNIEALAEGLGPNDRPSTNLKVAIMNRSGLRPIELLNEMTISGFDMEQELMKNLLDNIIFNHCK